MFLMFGVQLLSFVQVYVSDVWFNFCSCFCCLVFSYEVLFMFMFLMSGFNSCSCFYCLVFSFLVLSMLMFLMLGFIPVQVPVVWCLVFLFCHAQVFVFFCQTSSVCVQCYFICSCSCFCFFSVYVYVLDSIRKTINTAK